jgi:hypothetical protein
MLGEREASASLSPGMRKILVLSLPRRRNRMNLDTPIPAAVSLGKSIGNQTQA